MAEYRDELLDHEYDGIQELDNFLPRWWLNMFRLTIVFAFAYMIYFHVLDVGYLQEDEYRAEQDPYYVRTLEADSKLLGILPEYHSPMYGKGLDRTPRMTLLAGPARNIVLLSAATDTLEYVAVDDPDLLAAGAKTFMTKCAQCHGNYGQGIVGPNLTDDYWLHGATISNIVKSVKYGYPSKGMIPWLGTLDEEEIINAASYVQTLRGSNPPKGRTPQGDLVIF